MYKDIIFDHNCHDVLNDNENSLKIKWPIVKIDNRLIIDPVFSEFQFLGWLPDGDISDLLSWSLVITNETDINLTFYDRFIFDLDASIPNEENNFQSNAPDDQASDVDEYEIRTENAPANRPFECIVDVGNINRLIDIIDLSGLDYSFYSNPTNINYCGLGYWKVKCIRRRDNGNRENVGTGLLPARRRRREINLTFDDDNINFSAKVKGRMLSDKTWTEIRK